MSERSKGLISRLVPRAAANDGQALVPTESADKEVVAADGPVFRASLQGHFVGSRAGFLRRNLRLLLFVIVAGLPTLLASVYYGFVASDQYVTDIQFGVRTADAQHAGDVG